MIEPVDPEKPRCFFKAGEMVMARGSKENAPKIPFLILGVEWCWFLDDWMLIVLPVGSDKKEEMWWGNFRKIEENND